MNVELLYELDYWAHCVLQFSLLQLDIERVILTTTSPIIPQWSR